MKYAIVRNSRLLLKYVLNFQQLDSMTKEVISLSPGRGTLTDK